MGKAWLDISVPVKAGMVHWPGDPAFQMEWFLRIGRKGAPCNVSKLCFGTHTGTHMDAPLHFLANGATMDTMPLEATIGPARIIPIRDRESIKPDELKRYRIRRGERILFKTWNSSRAWKSPKFYEDFVFISKEAASFLAERRIRTVGVDYLSVGGFRKDMVQTHRTLLGGGIWIIEGLNLTRAKSGSCELVCLPLKLMGTEGAPARAVIRQS